MLTNLVALNGSYLLPAKVEEYHTDQHMLNFVSFICFILLCLVCFLASIHGCPIFGCRSSNNKF